MNLFKSNKLVSVATLVTATFATLSGLATTNKAQAAIIFTSNIGVQNFVFSVSNGDGLLDVSQATDTNDGIKVKAPAPGILYSDNNNNGRGLLSFGTFTRKFDVIPSSKILLTLNVNGQFNSRNGQAVTITPNIQALNGVGGDPMITYNLPVAGVKGNLIFNKTEQSVNEIPEGELELFGNFDIQGPPGFQVQFIFPNSIDASVSVPEPASVLSLLSIGTLGATLTFKRKLKPSKSSEKETTKVG